ncbi:unnamed protein product [Lactuca saligna]|uniref:Uncharacterized protein n=1 Tax=Lactuca saligna TaxID=75948 RepID=A0AA36EPT1_LACSI|nr:unnamed protein product [Lactuca saligna]
MDQDFESPIVEQEVFPSERDQTFGSSFEAPELDISKSSAEKDWIIGRQDIRISDLEKENSIKDANISDLQENLGGLTTLFFDLK